MYCKRFSISNNTFISCDFIEGGSMFTFNFGCNVWNWFYCDNIGLEVTEFQYEIVFQNFMFITLYALS